MAAFSIHIQGQVQGVGFRPLVLLYAVRYGISGWVSNGVNGVQILAVGSPAKIAEFYNAILQQPPQRAIITRSVFKEIPVPHPVPAQFNIAESKSEGVPNLLITPDLGMCAKCRGELQNYHNRRYRYPFTTCTQCGPRYSIMYALPYDRESTAMHPFAMCARCRSEYNNTRNRRFYSQTNSCPICAISLYLTNAAGSILQSGASAAIEQAVQCLQNGQIVAVKGIGGFLLLTDATQPEAVNRLRQRKNRPSKPFALLYPNLSALRLDARVSAAEAAAFLSIESPVVLVNLLPTPNSKLAAAAVAPNLGKIGAMQPYTPLLALISEQIQVPLVATSANTSGSPIIYQNETAWNELGHIADVFLCNNRNIVIPQDDSVLQFTTAGKRRIFLRRSRGFAPTLLPPLPHAESFSGLAMGAHMKSAFAFQHAGNTYLSQYLGNLESWEAQQTYRLTLQHLKTMLNAQPGTIYTDLHPDYFATRTGIEIAAQSNAATVAVQHHEAHFAAVLAENGYANPNPPKEPVLGVILDGTGLGTDGQVWGGELLAYRAGKFERMGHLSYFPVLLGNKMAREPRLCALSLLYSHTETAQQLLQSKFSAVEWPYYLRLLAAGNLLQTSSAGRLFDAVGCLLGLGDLMSYEGQNAMYAEAIAARYAHGRRLPATCRYKVVFTPSGCADVQQLVAAIAADVLNGVQPELIAFHFHLWWCHWVKHVAGLHGFRTVAFSGGVFQNALLADLMEKMTRKHHIQPLFHRLLSPNDEGIAYGQLAYPLLTGNFTA
ncbi:carbamoyltransferase HypF [Sphingobacteriales bacterium UPWRP_1]|nr:carbamoyltransferase HypF [Sphingobacteriales bacterium UPWRP_1]